MRVEQDGVRVIESLDRRAARLRRALSAAAIAIVTVVVAVGAAVVFLRRKPATLPTPVTITEEVQQVAPQAIVPVASKGLQAARQAATERQQTAKPARRARVTNAADANRAAEATRMQNTPDQTGSAAPQQRNDTLDSLTNDIVDAMRAAGHNEGIAAFPPRGTVPLKSGIVVPKDFELPEGYVRHYQTTDDGQVLDPILMFSPDYEFVDEKGQPMAVPSDGVVPPELAPAGLPLRTLEIPDSQGGRHAVRR